MNIDNCTSSTRPTQETAFKPTPYYYVNTAITPPKKQPWTIRNSTREKCHASQASRGPTAKTPRSSPSAINCTIHQWVDEQSSMVASASFSGSPSALSVCPVEVQHAGFHTPSPGYGLPMVTQLPVQWWVLGDLHHHGPSIISNGHLYLSQQPKQL